MQRASYTREGIRVCDACDRNDFSWSRYHIILHSVEKVNESNLAEVFTRPRELFID